MVQQMEQQRSPRRCICLLLLLHLAFRAAGNLEGDALTALRLSLSEPDTVFESWNATKVTPCTWSHVTCNDEDRVVRVDLGNANLSGQLVPQLGQLLKLQYLELYGNKITGGIPEELGDLTELVSLDLYMNNLSGPIPSSLGNLKKLRFLRLNNNTLSGKIPKSLNTLPLLQVFDISNNQLSGDIHVNGSFSKFTSIGFLLVLCLILGSMERLL